VGKNYLGTSFSRLKIYYGWQVVAVGFVLLLLMFGTRLSFGLYLKPLAENFGATRASISGSQSVYMVIYAIIALIAGSLADNYGPKRIIMGGAIFMGVGILLTSCINAVWQYYLTYGVLVAIGSGALYVPVVGAVSKFFTKQRNLAIGLTASGGGVGQYLFPLFVQKIMDLDGWQASFLYTSVLMLIFGVSLPWIFLRGRGLPEDAGCGEQKESGERDQGHAPGDSVGPKQYTLRQAMSTRPFWAYFMMYFIICFVIDGTVFVHLYPYLTDIGFSGQTAAKSLGYLGLISTGATIAFSPLGDKFNKRILLTSFLALHTLLLLWLIHIRSEFSLWGFTVFYGIILGAGWPLTVSILADIFGSRGVGSILGACTMAFGIAGLIAPWLAGYIFDLYNSYAPIFYVTVLLSLGGVICTCFIRKTKQMS
jgi:MFS family permease